MTDPELQIRGGGGGGGSNFFFPALQASLWSKNREGGGWVPWAPPLDPPLILFTMPLFKILFKVL